MKSHPLESLVPSKVTSVVSCPGLRHSTRNHHFRCIEKQCRHTSHGHPHPRLSSPHSGYNGGVAISNARKEMMPIAKTKELYLAGDNTTPQRQHNCKEKGRRFRRGKLAVLQGASWVRWTILAMYNALTQWISIIEDHIFTGWEDEKGNTERWQSM